MRMSSSRGRRPQKPLAKKKAPVSAEVIASIDYKSASVLKRFISDRGKILPRRHTGLNAAQQRLVAEHIKRARFMALLHYTADQLRG